MAVLDLQRMQSTQRRPPTGSNQSVLCLNSSLSTHALICL